MTAHNRFLPAPSVLRALRAIGLGVLVASCGGGGGTGPTVVPTPTPVPAPVPEILSQGNGTDICGPCGLWLYFTARAPGRVVITVNYTHPDNTFYLWLGPGHCTYEQALANQCSWSSTSSTGPNPRTLSQSVVAGEYTLVLDNRTDREERVSYQVVYTPIAGTTAARTPQPRGVFPGPPSR